MAELRCGGECREHSRHHLDFQQTLHVVVIDGGGGAGCEVEIKLSCSSLHRITHARALSFYTCTYAHKCSCNLRPPVTLIRPLQPEK